MLAYIGRRAILAVFTVWAISVLSFAIIQLPPGDYVTSYIAQMASMGSVVTDEEAQNLRIQYGLGQPIYVQYLKWMKQVVGGNFGMSMEWRRPVTEVIGERLWLTVVVSLAALLLTWVLALPIGIYSAVRQYSLFDYTFTTLSFLGFAMPVFWLALLLQIVFVDIYLKWHVRIFYTSGLNNIGQGTWSFDRLQHIALPVVTLCVVSFALYSRYMRASMLDVINSDYVRTARAKGVAEWRVITRHVVRNALIPVVTVAALNLGGLLGGAIVTETIFTLDGFGYYFIQSLQNSDFYAVMAYLVVTSVIIILFNLIADIVYGYLDPRIRYD